MIIKENAITSNTTRSEKKADIEHIVTFPILYGVGGRPTVIQNARKMGISLNFVPIAHILLNFRGGRFVSFTLICSMIFEPFLGAWLLSNPICCCDLSDLSLELTLYSQHVMFFDL